LTVSGVWLAAAKGMSNQNGEVTDPKAAQVVEKLESVGARSLIHPFSWWSGETRNVVYTEPKPETPGLWSQLEKLKVKAWLMDALGKASKTGDSR